jgi:hypothetical protein
VLERDEIGLGDQAEAGELAIGSGPRDPAQLRVAVAARGDELADDSTEAVARLVCLRDDVGGELPTTTKLHKL